MSIIARNFTFNGVALNDFDDKYMLVDLDNQDRGNAFSRQLQTSMITNDSPITHYYGSTASNVITFDIAICRRDWEFLTVEDCNQLSNWLMGDPIPKECHFDSCNVAVFNNTYFIGSFVSSSYLQSGLEQKYAMIFSFQNMSGYGFTPRYGYALSTEVSNVVTTQGSSTGEMIYPDFVITPNETGIVTINNLTDTSMDELSLNVTSGKVIKVSDRNLLNDDDTLCDMRTHLNTYNWPCLLNGRNEIYVTGNAVIQMYVRYFVNLGF